MAAGNGKGFTHRTISAVKNNHLFEDVYIDLSLFFYDADLSLNLSLSIDKGGHNMGKFDGLLLCSDLDDTLLTTDKNVSEENKKAIEYFKSEGGLFTFATGRTPLGASLMLEHIKPNAPMICFNGAGIYDFGKSELVWSKTLDKDAIEVVEFIDKTFPFSGIEVCTNEKIYFCKTNRVVEEHKRHEKFPDNYLDYHDIKEPWTKVLFMQEEQELEQVKNALLESPFAEKYSFIQSSPNYYELLPKGSSKGNGLMELSRIMRIPKEHTLGIGDNENDISLIENAGVGIAVANAISPVKEIADYITVDNNSHAISTVIYALNKGTISV